MKTTHLFCFVFFCFQFLFPQEIVKINDISYPADEFVRDYSLNIKAKGKEEALEDFIKTQLLLQDAKNKQIDTIESTKKIINNDLSKIRMSYLGVDSLKNHLMQMAIERGKVERKIQLFYISSNSDFASVPSKAINKMKKFMIGLQKGFTIEKLNPIIPEVKSLNNFEPFYVRYGQLGYELENLIYNTPVGSFSEVKIINNKYYLAKILEERESYGKLFLRIIYIKPSEDAKEKIEKAYSELNSGVSFSEVVKKYSQDEKTKHNNGELDTYQGNLREDILKEVLAIKNASFTQPILLEDGWYIFYKMLQEKPCSNLNYCRSKIEDEILKSDRKYVLDELIVNKAIKKTPYNFYEDVVLNLIKNVPENFYSTKTNLILTNDQTIILVNKKVFQTKELVDIINENKSKINNKVELDFFVNKIVSETLKKIIFDEYLENLEKYEPEYSILKEQTKQKALVYVLLKDVIYKKAVEDQEGLRKYYQSVKNQPKYIWPKRLDVDIYSCYNKNLLENLKSQIENKKTIEEIDNQFNKEKLNVFLESGILFLENPKLADLKVKEKGIYVVEKVENSKIFHVKNVLQPAAKTFEEAEIQIIEDYKEKYLDQYTKNLKNQSKIIVNNTALKQI